MVKINNKKIVVQSYLILGMSFIFSEMIYDIKIHIISLFVIISCIYYIYSRTRFLDNFLISYF